MNALATNYINKIELNFLDFLTDEELTLLKKNYKNSLVAFYIYIDSTEFIAYDIDGIRYDYIIKPETIYKINDNLKLGTKVFYQHAKNDKNREGYIGYIIYKKVLENQGIYFGIVGILIENEKLYNQHNLDSISLEGIPLKIENNELKTLKITAFALDNSEVHQPACKFAYRLKEIQLNKKNFVNNQESETEKENMDLNLEIIKKYISENDIKPHQIYDSYSIIGSIEIENGNFNVEGGDKKITEILKTKLKKYYLADQNEYTKIKNQLNDFEKIKSEYQEYKNFYVYNNVKNFLEKYVKENSLNKKLASYLMLEDNIKNFKFDNLDEDLKKYVNAKSKEFENLNKIFSEIDNDKKDLEDSY